MHQAKTLIERHLLFRGFDKTMEKEMAMEKKAALQAM